MSQAALETRELAIGYARRRGKDLRLASGLNLRLERGSLVGLLGPNGIGKSTLLRTLAGMQKPLVGQVLLEGADSRRLKPRELALRLSMALSRAPQPMLMTGFELVALGRLPRSDWLGRLTNQDRAIVAWAMSAVDSADLAARPIAELSDGQRQKLLIARALAQETGLMLLDEPTAFLDLPRRVDIMRLLKQLAHDTGRAILVSTHDLDQALRSCDELWLMRQDGMLTGAPEDLALNGGITQTFETDGLAFDIHSGAFALDPPEGPSIHVVGGGARAVWMRRALERNGYRLCADEGLARVTASENGRGGEWHVTVKGVQRQCQSIAAVLSALKKAGL